MEGVVLVCEKRHIVNIDIEQGGTEWAALRDSLADVGFGGEEGLVAR